MLGYWSREFVRDNPDLRECIYQTTLCSTGQTLKREPVRSKWTLFNATV